MAAKRAGAGVKVVYGGAAQRTCNRRFVWSQLLHGSLPVYTCRPGVNSQAERLIHFPMAPHIDQDDLVLTQLQFQSDAILQVDGNGVQPGQLALQSM